LGGGSQRDGGGGRNRQREERSIDYYTVVYGDTRSRSTGGLGARRGRRRARGQLRQRPAAAAVAPAGFLHRVLTPITPDERDSGHTTVLVAVDVVPSLLPRPRPRPRAQSGSVYRRMVRCMQGAEARVRSLYRCGVALEHRRPVDRRVTRPLPSEDGPCFLHAVATGRMW
jgi:hypothetical protein